MGLCAHFPLSLLGRCLACTCADLVLDTVSEFTCALVLLYLTLVISLELSITSGFATFLFPLLHRSEPGGEGYDKDIPFSAKYFEVSHSPH